MRVGKGVKLESHVEKGVKLESLKGKLERDYHS